ncbi:hypothetical protein LDJ79_13920 [Vibrio tritonius]|uniref:Uncharacterized protein n=1 Tax=Vibrio tritonius TaxID=1435069 RepID=A0ABS7YQ72_9VIBR|nr:hypothetical protein [Vibrio tritonius]MCA2017217.1 hypothetical protein [Vibrio tritonius]
MYKVVREVRYCSDCETKTSNVAVLVRKQSKFIGEKYRHINEFIVGAIKGWAFGAFIVSMDDFEGHLICENCGKKTIER